MEDYTGEPIDNAVFEANCKVMDLANIVLKVIHNDDPLGAAPVPANIPSADPAASNAPLVLDMNNIPDTDDDIGAGDVW